MVWWAEFSDGAQDSCVLMHMPCIIFSIWLLSRRDAVIKLKVFFFNIYITYKYIMIKMKIKMRINLFEHKGQ